MSKKIFFSWQSDIKPARNKLQKALEIAVRQLGSELEEAERPELDSDTKGTFGSDEIMSIIFKKVDEADIFVADVTPITSTRSRKLVPNPNVMTEIGYAIKAKGFGANLFIFCTDKKIDIRKMPFDISGRHLYGFSLNDDPSKIAESLKPILAGMLQSARAASDGEHPHVYADSASFQVWSDGVTVSLNIYNSEDKDYVLDAIEIEDKSAEPFKNLKSKMSTNGISIMGIGAVFDDPSPLLRMTISRGNKSYRLEQKIITTPRADGRYNFAKFVESSAIVPD